MRPEGHTKVTIATVITDSGLFSLPVDPDPDLVREVLDKLKESMNGSSDITERNQIRAEAIKRLKQKKVADPRTLILGHLGGAEKQKSEDGGEEGETILFPVVEPWGEEVSADALLREIAEAIETFMVLPPKAADTIALWVLSVWCLEAFDVFPMLIFSSPSPICGKSTMLEILGELVPRPLLASGVTSAVIYRVTDRYDPTILADEADTWGSDASEDLRGVINSGHRRSSAVIWRCVGESYEPKGFSTWGGKILALIGKQMPVTWKSRSIIITMQRKRKEDQVSKLRGKRLQEFAPLARKACRWADDTAERARGLEPNLPETLQARAQDNWEPLVTVADLAGGEWPQIARKAAVAFSKDEDDTDVGIALLTDIRAVLTDLGAVHGSINKEGSTEETAIFSQDLTDSLLEIEDSPWVEHGRNRKPITKGQVAHLLKRFDISSRNVTVNGRQKKGYSLPMFQDAFERYIFLLEPETPLPKRPAVRLQDSKGVTPIPSRPLEGSSDVSGTPEVLCSLSNGRLDGCKEGGGAKKKKTDGAPSVIRDGGTVPDWLVEEAPPKLGSEWLTPEQYFKSQNETPPTEAELKQKIRRARLCGREEEAKALEATLPPTDKDLPF